MKKLNILMLIAIMFALTSCSEVKNERSQILAHSTTDTLLQHSSIEITVEASHSSSTGNKTSQALSEEKQDKQKIVSISRKEAGLDAIPWINFEKHVLNTRINGLLLDKKGYKDADYADGIISEGNCILLGQRYKQNVIDDIEIGTAVKDVVKELGIPSFTDQAGIYYKTRLYYIFFMGRSKVELVAVTCSPSNYSKDILFKLLSGLEAGNAEDALYKKLDEDKELSAFFNILGAIHGGGWYYASTNGIHVNTFPDDNYITVYNNFEGDLYKITGKDTVYPVSFDNSDYLMNQLKMQSNSYLSTNQRFDKEGVLSPDGKRKFVYDWITSMYTYFTVRTQDNSKPDMVYNVMANDYRWLNNEYIIYTDFNTNMPWAFNAAICDGKAVNILESAGINEQDFFQNNYNKYQITNITKNTFKIKLYKGKEFYKDFDINYSFDDKGGIKFTSPTTEKDYLGMGFELVSKETLGVLRCFLPEGDVVTAIGEPEEKSELLVWGADGMEHQTWFYKNSGIELSMVEREKKLSVFGIRMNSPCTLKTSRNIGIGSTLAEVAEAYKNEIDPTELGHDSSELVAGTVYGGVIFQFRDGRVSQIFIGAATE